MRITNLILPLAAVTLAGCITPPAVKERAQAVMMTGACLDMFTSQNYQERSQSPIHGTPAFAIAVGTDDGKKVVVCNMATGGSLTTSMEQRRNYALQSCEQRRENYMAKKPNSLLGPCKVFAEGNNIVYEEDTK